MNPQVGSLDGIYELRFASLHCDGQPACFPCDAQGHVSLDEMSDLARLHYMRARACIGYEFALPSVACIDADAVKTVLLN